MATMSSSGDRTVRDELLHAAVGLLDDHGPDALQTRKVSSAAGTSTMAVYTHFGGMRALIAEVAEEGRRQFDIALTGTADTDSGGRHVVLRRRLPQLRHRTAAHVSADVLHTSAPGSTRRGGLSRARRGGLSRAGRGQGQLQDQKRNDGRRASNLRRPTDPRCRAPDRARSRNFVNSTSLASIQAARSGGASALPRISWAKPRGQSVMLSQWDLPV